MLLVVHDPYTDLVLILVPEYKMLPQIELSASVRDGACGTTLEKEHVNLPRIIEGELHPPPARFEVKADRQQAVQHSLRIMCAPGAPSYSIWQLLL